MVTSCPIGLECPYETRKRTGRKFCRNYRRCDDQGRSWEIPYIRRDGCLEVKSSTNRFDWRKVDKTALTGPQRHGVCHLPSGYYVAVEDNDDIYYRIKEEWRKAGWQAAVSLSAKPKHEPK